MSECDICRLQGNNGRAPGRIEIVESAWMTKDGEPVTVRRSWRDRLCSRPWRPWRATVTIVPQVPRMDYLQIGPNRVVAHPAAVKALRAALAADQSAAEPPETGEGVSIPGRTVTTQRTTGTVKVRMTTRPAEPETGKEQ